MKVNFSNGEGFQVGFSKGNDNKDHFIGKDNVHELVFCILENSWPGNPKNRELQKSKCLIGWWKFDNRKVSDTQKQEAETATFLGSFTPQLMNKGHAVCPKCEHCLSLTSGFLIVIWSEYGSERSVFFFLGDLASGLKKNTGSQSGVFLSWCQLYSLPKHLEASQLEWLMKIQFQATLHAMKIPFFAFVARSNLSYCSANLPPCLCVSVELYPSKNMIMGRSYIFVLCFLWLGRGTRFGPQKRTDFWILASLNTKLLFWALLKFWSNTPSIQSCHVHQIMYLPLLVLQASSATVQQVYIIQCYNAFFFQTQHF